MSIIRKIRWNLYGRRRRVNAVIQEIERSRMMYRLAQLERTPMSTVRTVEHRSGNMIG
ncbi:hypothetical protein [Alicyclobacillus ferrooxydans]|uniref:hypothetical protein n=1 Tax=Alicyclobacillus ferrooxydans TaxID=471514 RepID=UPI000B2B77C9|nr:hypothetical protein [Alicyclobacillus ferrooxydans]